jgi:hypothetical protein
MRPGSLSRPVAVLLVALLAFALACGGGGADLAGPTVGSLEVTTSTSGPEPDADGYGVSLDGGAAAPIGANATRRHDGLAPGAHTVTLTGVAANCTVSAGASRSVTVTVDAVASVAFAVTCAPTTGAIQVTAQTSGADQDPDGYTVALDGGAATPLGANAAISWAGLAPGAHTVAIAGVAGNCRVAGDNPRTAAVSAGDTLAVAFGITCEALPPASGTLELTTTTAGRNPDPDGYSFTVDGGAPQPIGLNASTSVTGVAAGAHTVQLAGLAANCAIGGDNPRSVTVPAGGTARVAFAVTCSATTGSIEVRAQTSGSPVDPDGYQASVDGGAPRAVGAGGSVTFDGVEAGAHAVLLDGVAANCSVQGGNPRSVSVSAGQSASVTFNVACTPTTGSLQVTINGLPSGTPAAVAVSGPNGFSQALPATGTLDGLQPGSYTVTATQVANGSVTYVPSPASRDVAVAAGATARATVTYASTGAGVNLRIDGWNLTQSTQSAAGDIPLVTNRDGYIRVFVLADGPNTARPVVRLRLFRSGALVRTLSIPAPSGAVPTQRPDRQLAGSWNVKIPRELIVPGLQVLADVDPDNTVAESDEADNAYPSSGIPFQPTVQDAPILGITFVPVQQANGLRGDVTDANRSTYLDVSRRMHPLSAADGSVHALYNTSVTLEADDGNGGWRTLLSELDAIRVAEGTDRNYFGVVQIGYGSGIAGLGYIGAPTAIGYDRSFDRSRVVAHELGHNWGRKHAPCGNAPNPDPFYPYAGGLIGVYGIDMQNEVLEQPELPDIMAYCSNPWISDYTYRGVLQFRRAAAASAGVAAFAPPQPSLLVWGRIVNGRPVLEPAFEVVTRPSLPHRPGRYTVEGLTQDGGRAFALSFDPPEVADAPAGGQSFAFAVPLGPEGASRIAALRLRGPVGAAAASRVLPPAGAAVVPPPIDARRTSRGVALRGEANANPMVLVRDPDTGEVLSIARGGSAEVPTSKATLDLIVSDRVGSRSVRVRY